MRCTKLVLVSVFSVAVASAQTAQRFTSPYLTAARQASAWLDTLAVPQPTGTAWLVSQGGQASYVTTGVDAGAAGIGLFYLRLYQATGDQAALAKARSAADFVDSQYRAGNMQGDYDWFSGVASGGDFFLTLYAATGDTTFRDRATFAGDWLVSNAIADSNGYHWEFPGLTNVYTSLAHGTGGVALFLTQLYEVTGNATYLQYAEGAVQWLRQYIVTLGDSAIGWKRLTTDSGVYNGWCGGSAGVYFILKELWKATGNSDYHDLMVATARGLVTAADWSCSGGGAYSASGGCPAGEEPLAAWGYGVPSNSDYPEIMCHGVASIVIALFDAFHVTGDESFLDPARAGARWLQSVAQVQPQGQRWEHIYRTGLLEPGFLTGTASVGYAFVRFAAMDPGARTVDGRPSNAWRWPPNPQYLRVAEAAGEYLLSIADHPQPNQARWLTYILPKPAWASDPVGYPVEYDSGWYTGAAGIGIFFLDLYDAERRVPSAPDEFSHLNP